jgi:hypothetical protein
MNLTVANKVMVYEMALIKARAILSVVRQLLVPAQQPTAPTPMPKPPRPLTWPVW